MALCALALSFACIGNAHAFNTITVRVTVTSASTLSACWDSWCNKPDLFVVFYGTGTGAQAPACKSLSVVDRVNVGNPAPADWRCDFIVNRPGRLYIGLYDGDGPNSDNTQGQQVDISPGPELSASIDLENIARGRGTSSSLSSRGDDGTISYTVSAVINPGALNSFTSDRMSFRPSAGEQIVVTAGASGAPYTLLRVRGNNSAGTEVWSIFGYLDDPAQTEKKFVWQGRDANGNVLPPGNYSLRLRAEDSTTGDLAIGPIGGLTTVGGFLTQSVEILPPPIAPSLTVLGTDPTSRWAPDVGDLSIRVVSSASATVSGEVFNNPNCTGTRLLGLDPIALQPLNPGTLLWRGPIVMGGAFAAGMYGVKVSGVSAGAPTLPASVCQPIEMIAAPRAMLYVQHAPFVAQPGQTVELTARSVDPSGAPRVAGRIDVWGSVQAIPGVAPAPPTGSLRTCTIASSCTATIAVPAGQSFLSWNATAEDRAGTTVATTGWRGQRITESAAFAQSTGFAVPIDVALLGPGMASARDDARSLDLLFSASTDLDWTSAIDRQNIGDALNRFMTRLWGIEGNGTPAPTTFLSRPDLVRLYVTPERRVVSWNPADNLCEWSAPNAPWADAAGILHKTDCRDNAYPSIRSFSAKLLARDVIFHELHHALFGLQDEYCCDGGYGENQPDPNIYNSLTTCMADPLFRPGGCTSIVETGTVTGAATGNVYFRLDLEATDVMIGNSTQRAADVRRAIRKEGQCDASGC